MSNALATKAGITEESGGKMMESAKEIEATFAIYKSEKYGQVEDSIALALCLVKIREKMAVILPLLRALYNTEIGFKCDRPNEKDRTHYDDATLVECACVAILKGVRLTGNMFNIIAGRTYITKEGYQFKLGQLPGLTDFVPRFGLPALNGSGALVKTKATWKFHGKEGVHEQEFAVKLNAYMGADGALGKAKRKLYAHVFDVLTGFTLPDTDAEESSELMIGSTARTDSLAGQLGIEAPKQDPANLVGDAEAPEGTGERILIEGKALEDQEAAAADPEPVKPPADPQFTLPPAGNDKLLQLLHQYEAVGQNIWHWLGMYQINNVAELSLKKAKDRSVLCTALSARIDDLRKDKPGLFQNPATMKP